MSISVEQERVAMMLEAWNARAKRDAARIAELERLLAKKTASAKKLSGRVQMLERQRGKLLGALDGMLTDIHSLMAESYGVAGLHLNGDVATWDELSEGGRFEWLMHISEARTVVEEVKSEK